MRNECSFRSLFEGSRFSRPHAAPSSEPRRDRREVFSVAAIAIALKHDERFFHHFVQRVCRIPKPYPQLKDVEVDVQPHHHTDLAIKHRNRQRLYVLEFKFHSRLKPKQNPEIKEAFMKEPSGYGYQITSERDYAKLTERHYFVLQKTRAFDPLTIRNLQCRSIAWKDVDPGRTLASPLVNDIL